MHRVYPFVIPLVCALLVGILVMSYAASRSGGEPRSDARTLPFRLEDVVTARITPKLPFFVADVDLDGNDDLLINEPNRLLWYRLRGTEMVLAGDAAYERPGSTRMVTDGNGDGYPDFFVLTESPEGPMLSCHDWFSAKGSSAPLYTVGPLLLPTWYAADFWRKIDFFGSFTAENGAHPAILIGLNPKKLEGVCRSLLAFDGVTGKELWRFDFGPHSYELACGHFGANDPRVLFTTQAVGTGVSCKGTADSVSYIFCLDARDGHLLWKKNLAGFAGRSSLALADINGDGQNEILVARCLGARDPHLLDNSSPWTVAALSREGAVLDTVPLGIRATSIRAVNLDTGASPEMLVQGSKGNLVILNYDFAVRRVISASQGADPSKPANPQIFGVWDLTEDGKPEIICRLDSMLIVRDHEGTPIARRGFAYEFQARLARYDGRTHIVAARGDSIHIMALERTPFAVRLRAHARRSTIVALAAAALLVCAAGLTVRRRLTRRGTDHLVLDGARNDLLTAMSAFGHGGSSLKIIDRIRLHLKNWDRVQSDAAAREELFARLHATFAETVVPELKHIVMLAHKACVPEEIWGTIMARAGLAGQAMEAILAAGSGGGVVGREGNIARALESLGDVDESIARIRSHLRSVFRTPAVEALERAVARFRDEYGGKSISLVLPSEASAIEGVFISSVAFDKILEALLSNSARATERRTDAAITIEVQWEGDYCKIDIRDNGCGIPREDWERAFERYYTTKEEGGFGLYYTRAELARFGGKIFILDSVVGSATTVRVVLRKS